MATPGQPVGSGSYKSRAELFEIGSGEGVAEPGYPRAATTTDPATETPLESSHADVKRLASRSTGTPDAQRSRQRFSMRPKLKMLWWGTSPLAWGQVVK